MTPATDGTPPTSTGRLLSLDAFRGFTIAGMVLVNNPGSWAHVYAPLAHAPWDGWTPTDLVFPFFLLIVGVSIPLALSRRVERPGGRSGALAKVVRRSVVIFGLGLLLNGFPHYDLESIRIPGVLQRIAVCYLAASALFLALGIRGQAIAAAALLLGYWALLTSVPAPGFGTGRLDMEGNLAAYLDRVALAGHIYRPTYDPEGLLSTLPAIGTTLIGVLAGHGIRAGRGPAETCAGLFVGGALATVLGWAWGGLFPINKALWTSSYACFTAGLGLQVLGLCTWCIEVRGYRRWATPFLVFGSNAIAVFVLSGLLARLLTIVKVPGIADGSVALKTAIHERLFASWLPPEAASMAFGIAYVLLWLALMVPLYRGRISIRV